jgi:D-lactate dehydrogenase
MRDNCTRRLHVPGVCRTIVKALADPARSPPRPDSGRPLAVKLAQPNNEAIRAAQTSPMPDRVSDDLAGGSPPQLIADLEDALGEGRVLSTALDLVRYATDASPYRMVPAAVVIARDTSDISNALRFARRAGRSAVFRAGGTSLSGQAQTDDLLVDVR